MNNIMQVQFKKSCCMCNKEAKYKLELIDMDSPDKKYFKHFCEEHKVV
jgi:hypothetical protein